MADGTSEAPAKKMKKRGFGMMAMVINAVLSFATGSLGTLGVLAGTNSIRTDAEREAANAAEKLQNANQKKG